MNVFSHEDAPQAWSASVAMLWLVPARNRATVCGATVAARCFHSVRPGRDADHSPHQCRGREWVGAIPPLPPSASMACSGTALLLLSHEHFSRAIVAALFGCLFLVLCNMDGFDTVTGHTWSGLDNVEVGRQQLYTANLTDTYRGGSSVSSRVCPQGC
jgi:hypothetical protein